MIPKIDIVNGAYKLMRISGLTRSADPESISIGLDVLDDYMAELDATLTTGYIQPTTYGQSDPSDISGLTVFIAGPVKKLLARELMEYFGKPITQTLQLIAEGGMRSLENSLVFVENAQLPGTLPIGSGNEWDYRTDKFYPEPNNDDGAENFYEDDVFIHTIDWTLYAINDTIVSVDYEMSSGLVLSDKALSDNISTTTISFNRIGQFTLCAVGTKSNGEKQTRRFVFNATSCISLNTIT